MIVPLAVDLKYKQSNPILLEIAERARSIVLRKLEGTGYAFIGRQKEPGSLAEKIESGRYQAWSELDDLYACTIVVPTSAEEPEILEFLRGAFREIQTRKRGSALKDPSTFRYDSTRFIATLRPTLIPEPPDALSRQRFEVQVRTAFEHAWTVATHSIVYKGDSIDWRRLRLIAQLKAATEQMDSLIAGFDQAAELITEENWPEISHRRAIEQMFRARFTNGDIPRDCEPASWVRFSENVYTLIRAAVGARRFVERDVMDRTIQLIQLTIDKNKGEAFPRSISLLQFVLGSLAAGGAIRGALADYCPVVTDQLRSVFPAVGDIKASFNFELPGVA
ncbi:ppGpp synthetase/RelA/SpoT-type nucleotidyltransferase [Povalibacter uvarum]|uniref:PpGpp synthetase/RelA/SpoT-type nucleotidyltransferase n=1 Tax=Povalibacter uvarum TaxID=732238 RepID=A0A841HQL1_9GAMM|nr:RelA/SpoT domain-containing protein [Povalibacter uvarum]MBB6095641.1 ppGpp synthetase/RelA/SpoT-type nucleotidyltransferase [Povalibacter uvarum]